jgi:hypothetical protein
MDCQIKRAYYKLFFLCTKKGSRFLPNPLPKQTGRLGPLKESRQMILFVDVQLKKIYAQGNKYPWIRPEACPRCSHYKLWGHGYVTRLFDGFRDALFLKCYRCPDCGCVITFRPKSHFMAIQSSTSSILSSISCRIKTGRWPPWGAKSRKRHWLVNLRRNIKVHLTNTWAQGEIAGFARLQALGIVPVSVRIM